MHYSVAYLKRKHYCRQLRFLHVAPGMKLLTHAHQEHKGGNKTIRHRGEVKGCRSSQPDSTEGYGWHEDLRHGTIKSQQTQANFLLQYTWSKCSSNLQLA